MMAATMSGIIARRMSEYQLSRQGLGLPPPLFTATCYVPAYSLRSQTALLMKDHVTDVTWLVLSRDIVDEMLLLDTHLAGR